jgi:hypothetical protein
VDSTFRFSINLKGRPAMPTQKFLQLGAAAQEDDGSGHATGTSGRGGTPIFHSFAPPLHHQRELRASALIVGLQVAPGHRIAVNVFDGKLDARNRRFARAGKAPTDVDANIMNQLGLSSRTIQRERVI